MNPIARTSAFLVAAVVCTLWAVYLTVWQTPEEVAGFDQVSEPFYPDFTDPNEADTLVVAAFDEDTATARTFSVVNRDGDFVIPTHHDYPAEATEQLAKTAASVTGIERGALMGRRKSEHERFGVVDPLDAENAALKGRGKRITLRSGGVDGEELVDLIIGNSVEGQEGKFYVRRADEDAVYAASINVEVSTKFGDWIEPDLLKLDRDNVNRLILNEYQADLERGIMTTPKQSVLTREKFSDPWVLQDLMDDTLQVKEQAVDDLAKNVDELKIVGVRPKPEGLRPDLSIDPRVEQNPLTFQVLQGSLISRGFFAPELPNGRRELVSTEGELLAGTNQGALYHLHFGNLFNGSLKEIEIGQEDGDSKKDGDSSKGDEDSDNEDSASSEDSPSRYMFVRVEFDPTLIGPKPEPPVAPTPPPGVKEDGEQPEAKPQPESGEASSAGGDAAQPASDASGQGDAEKQPAGDDDAACDPFQDEPAKDEPTKDKVAGESTEPSADEKSAAKPDEETTVKPTATDQPSGSADPPPAAEPAGNQPPAENAEPAEKTEPGEKTEAAEKPADEQPAEPVDPVAAYRIAKNQYEAALETYKNDLADYERRVKEGQQKVDELNKRFEGWFYVISAQSFKELKLSRDELLEPRTAEPAEGGPAGPGLPGGAFPGGLPGGGLPGSGFPGSGLPGGNN